MVHSTDCVVIGAGPAGLATSSTLAEHGVDHLILERGRVGQTWRTQRWDSFRLNTAGWLNSVLGEQPRDAYATAPEVVELLEKLAGRAPVREHTAVIQLRPVEGGFMVRTADGEFHARAVVVATGDQNLPRRSPLSLKVPDWVAQYHAAEYRSPGALPPGAVLVVGSGQSGCQIAEELVTSGRRVFLATSPVGRVPTPYRGLDPIAWLADAGFFDQRPADLPDPGVMDDPQPIIAPGGRGLSLQALARAGVTLVGRLVDLIRSQAHFDGSTAANVAAGDAFAARVRGMIDEMIRRRGLIVAPATPHETDASIDVDPPVAIDLRAHQVSTIIWCTGFTGDFSWLERGLVDSQGQPRRTEAAAIVPGIWYVGLRWLVRRGSGVLYGMPGDAQTVATSVRHHVLGPHVP